MEKRIENIKKQISKLELDLMELETLIDLYYTDKEAFNLRTTKTVKLPRYIEGDYPDYFKHLVIKYKIKIKTKSIDLGMICYQLRSRIKEKLKNAYKALETPPQIKEKKTILELGNFELKKNRIYFKEPLAKVGKSGKANYQIYSKGLYYYYHSYVRGGGLVKLKVENDSFGCTLALIYSRNLRATNSLAGKVVKSTEVGPLNKEGTFWFKNKKILDGYPKLYLNIQKEKHKIILFLEDKKNRSESFIFDLKRKKVRYEDLYFYTSSKIISKSFLDRLVPPLYDLTKV